MAGGCHICASLREFFNELLGLAQSPKNGTEPSRKVLRRLEKLEQLPPTQQTTLLRAIGSLPKGVAM